MSKKEQFIKLVKILMDQVGFIDGGGEWDDALDFWNSLQITADKEKPTFTENGKLVLKYMQNNKDTYNNLFKAKDLGEGIGISSRTASGAMRKLVNDSYAEKVGESPVIYSLTEKGINANLDSEN